MLWTIKSWAQVFGCLLIFVVLPRLKAAGPEAVDAAAEERVATFDAAWRIIHESYFDPTFHGLDWDAVRTELRPQAEAARSVEALRDVIEQMLKRLGASHMSLIPGDLARALRPVQASPENAASADRGPATPSPTYRPEDESDRGEGGNGELGMDFRILGNQVLVTRVETNGAAFQAGVQPGWTIDAVGRKPVGALLATLPPALPAVQSEFIAWGLIKGRLTGTPGTTASVRFLDGKNEPVLLEIERRPPRGEPAKLGYLPTFFARVDSERLNLPTGDEVGLIRFNLWMIPIVRALDQKIDEFRSAKGIILDLRGNLGGVGGMILGVSGHFLPDRISLGTLKMRGGELKFIANPRRVNGSGQRVAPYAGPLAILIDGLSLSAAEVFAGGMQAIGRARVFGERSGGQALPAVWDRLPNGDILYHAFGDFVAPDGRRMEGRGVEPDEVVPLRREDLVAGRDAPLAAALRWIGEQQTAPLDSRRLPPVSKE